MIPRMLKKKYDLYNLLERITYLEFNTKYAKKTPTKKECNDALTMATLNSFYMDYWFGKIMNPTFNNPNKIRHELFDKIVEKCGLLDTPRD